MSTWRKVALEKLPSCKALIEKAATPMELWIDLGSEFHIAYQEPRNESMLSAIYSYALWCLEARDPTTSSAVVVCLFEDLPLNSAARKDLPHRIGKTLFLGLTNVFKYHLSAEEHRRFVDEFLEASEKLSKSKSDKRKSRRGSTRPLK